MIIKAIGSIASCLYNGVERQMEPIRLARMGCSLISSGCSIKGNIPGDYLGSYLAGNQRNDGGWADVEETLWCIGYLRSFGSRYCDSVNLGYKWLISARVGCGAWGKSNRDQARIPITALAAVLAPDVIDYQATNWLSKQWKYDLEGPTPLTYKGAFFLLAQSHPHYQKVNRLLVRTINYLKTEQQDDGGFAPWKGHPVGSDPWTTGIVLWGLSSSGKHAPKTTIRRAIQWLESTQLSNGLWPYHYLDDGTAMALIGLSSALAVLRN